MKWLKDFFRFGRKARQAERTRRQNVIDDRLYRRGLEPLSKGDDNQREVDRLMRTTRPAPTPEIHRQGHRPWTGRVASDGYDPMTDPSNPASPLYNTLIGGHYAATEPVYAPPSSDDGGRYSSASCDTGSSSESYSSSSSDSSSSYDSSSSSSDSSSSGGGCD